MCGIFGSPTLTPSVKRMLPYLGLEMEERGRDAWGASNGSAIVKHTGPLVDSWYKEEETFEGWDTGIFHTRGASCGSPRSVENAHPFSYQKADGTWVIGIHNGVISNHAELNTRYNRKCEVDSMHIWMHLAEGKTWADLSGWANLAWYETNREGVQTMNLARFNNDALNVAELEQGEFVFCSTVMPVNTVARLMGNPVKRWFNIEETYNYWFDLNDQGKLTLFKEDKPLPFVKPQYGGHGGRHSACYNPSYPNANEDFCVKCGNTRVWNDDSLLCFQCFGLIVTEFLQEEGKLVVGATS